MRRSFKFPAALHLQCSGPREHISSSILGTKTSIPTVTLLQRYRLQEGSGDRKRPLRRSMAKSPRKSSRTCRSEEHTSELQSLMRISYAVFCLKKKKKHHIIQ